MNLENIIFYGVVGIAVSLALHFMNKGTSRSVGKNINGEVELRMNKLYQVMGHLCIVLITIIGLAVIYYQDIEIFVIGGFVFLLFGGLGIPTLMYYNNHKLKFDEESIVVHNWLGKPDEIKWAEIQSVKFNPLSGYLKIKGANKKLTIHQHLVGLKEFLRKMEEKTEWRVRELKLPIDMGESKSGYQTSQLPHDHTLISSEQQAEDLYYEFIESETGVHQIGGKKPKEFKYPENNFIANLQYLGFLDNNDPKFDWLPFKLQLICPIYLNIDEIVLDYENELEPKIITPKDTAEIESEYLELTRDSYLEFEAVKTELIISEKIDDMECIGISNRILEVQQMVIPICPKSGKEMKFVCQLMTYGRIPVVERNFETDEEYLEHMNFWGDGSLFVFCEPNSKTVSYFIQHT